MAKRYRPDPTLKKLVGLRWRRAEQALASIELEVKRVKGQIRSMELSLLEKRPGVLQRQLESTLAGNYYLNWQVAELRRLEEKFKKLLAQREIAKQALRNAMYAKQNLE